MLKKEDVEHVAKLSRLELSDAEKEKFAPQLSSVFEMFDQPRPRRREAGKLDAEDLSNVEETSQVTGLENITRNDEIKQYPDLTQCTSEELLSNAPQKEGTDIIVPRVIDRTVRHSELDSESSEIPHQVRDGTEQGGKG